MKKTILFLFIFILSACEKNDLVIPVEDPLFKAELIIDGQTTAFFAGVDDYYMFSNIVEDDSTVILRSLLLPENENGPDKSGFGLDFIIRDSEELKRALESNSLVFHKNIEVSGILNRLSTISNTEVPFNAAWQINDTQHLANGPIELHQTTEDTLHLNYFLEDEGLVHFDQILRPVVRGNYSIWIEIEKSGQGFSVVAKSNADHFNVIWSDGTVGVTKTILPNQQYSARLNSLALGSINILISIPESTPEGRSTFGFMNENSSLNTPSAIHVPVDILYRNESGKSFRSQNILQEPIAKIDIISVSPYKPNESGIMTYQIAGICQAMLKAGDGEVIQLNEGRFSIAVPILK